MKIKCILIEPCKYPKTVEIERKLESFQRAVGGIVEAVYPFDDDVILLCNEEGKIDGRSKPNRYIGEIQDIIFGPFLLVSIDDDGNFDSLTKDNIEKYTEKYHYPEVFFKTGEEIQVLKLR